MNKGFTLIEVIFAVSVVIIGVLAAHSVTQRMVSYTHGSASRFTAAYLAKEGIEIIRNIRDTNWVNPTDSWKNGLTNCGGGCEAGYDTPDVSDPSLSLWSDPGTPLNLENATGLYGYGAGTQTKFKRKITIDDSMANILEVTVEVTWEEKGKPYGPIKAQEKLYDWKQP